MWTLVYKGLPVKPVRSMLGASEPKGSCLLRHFFESPAVKKNCISSGPLHIVSVVTVPVFAELADK